MKLIKFFPALVFLFSLSFFFTHELSAQQAGKSSIEVRAGLGLLPTFLKDHTNTELVPVSLELRYRANDRFSVGVLAGASTSEALMDFNNGDKQLVRNHFRSLVVRGAVHATQFERWDIYGGIILGYSDSEVSYTSLNEEKTGDPASLPVPAERDGLMFSGFVGTSYLLSDRTSIFGELGYGLSLATVGAAVRF